MLAFIRACVVVLDVYAGLVTAESAIELHAGRQSVEIGLIGHVKRIDKQLAVHSRMLISLYVYLVAGLCLCESVLQTHGLVP